MSGVAWESDRKAGEMGGTTQVVNQTAGQMGGAALEVNNVAGTTLEVDRDIQGRDLEALAKPPRRAAKRLEVSIDG